MNLVVSENIDLPNLFRLAEALLQAPGIIPAHFRTAGQVVAVVLAGRELGIPPMASLRTVNIVQGRVVLDAALQLGLMIARGVKHCWQKDGTDGEAVLVLERPGVPPHTSRYTLAMATQARLTGKDNWQKHPDAMLRARAVSAAGRAYMPDVLAGVYVPGELDDDAPAAVAPAPRTLEVVQPPPASASSQPPEAAAALPEDSAEALAASLYAVTSRPAFGLLRDKARLKKPGMTRDEQLLVKAGLDFAEKRLLELEQADEDRRAEAEAAEAALADKVDQALGGVPPPQTESTLSQEGSAQ